MTYPNRKTPGVYVEEVSAFPNGVVPVPTAVPAFVGYTPKAEYQGKSCINEAIKITSFAEFQAYFCYPEPAPPAEPVKQYSPQYYLVNHRNRPPGGDYIEMGNRFYTVTPDPGSIYYLYNSVKLFYQNGGGDAYIVSVGTYGQATGQALIPGKPLINPNVKLNELLKGISVLKKKSEPTMYICPEATLLSVKNNGSLMQAMLAQNAQVNTAISIFDIIGAHKPDPANFMDDIQTFRSHTGVNGLSYGVAYYPFIGTTVMQMNDLDFTNLMGGKLGPLKELLNPQGQTDSPIGRVFENIEDREDNKLTNTQLNNALLIASKDYASIMALVLKEANILPPSGAMAGVMTRIDTQTGVWKAPANVSIVGAAYLPIRLTENQQTGLNVDAVSGKSVNAIRSFPGRGILVWGARTLAGNSQEWRYVPVRRTAIFIEQSIKISTQAFVFEPNDANTWTTVKSVASNFLTNIWKEGGLVGATPEQAFFVKCGLGETMTAQDILEERMIIEIGMAVARPADFMILKIAHKMAKS